MPAAHPPVDPTPRRPHTVAQNCPAAIPPRGGVNFVLVVLLKCFLTLPLRLLPYYSLLHWLIKYLRSRGRLKESLVEAGKTVVRDIAQTALGDSNVYGTRQSAISSWGESPESVTSAPPSTTTTSKIAQTYVV